MAKKSKHFGIHIDAGPDTYGNPRDGVDLYTVTGKYVGFVDRGYRSLPQALAEEGFMNVIILAKIPTSVKYYKVSLKG